MRRTTSCLQLSTPSHTASPRVGLTLFRSGTLDFLSLSSLDLQVKKLKPKQKD